MIGTSGGSGQIVALVAGTVASIVIIITTMRTWLRSYVDDRANVCCDVKLDPLEKTVSRLSTDVAVLKTQQRRRS